MVLQCIFWFGWFELEFISVCYCSVLCHWILQNNFHLKVNFTDTNCHRSVCVHLYRIQNTELYIESYTYYLLAGRALPSDWFVNTLQFYYTCLWEFFHSNFILIWNSNKIGLFRFDRWGAEHNVWLKSVI